VHYYNYLALIFDCLADFSFLFRKLVSYSGPESKWLYPVLADSILKATHRFD
jgi:hypothetical protein